MTGEYRRAFRELADPSGPLRVRPRVSRFPNVAREAGVAIDGHSGGAIMEDFDNDGLLDLMVSSEGFYDSVRFLVNQGDGTFADRTRQAGLDGIGYSLNITDAIFDNDGYVDVPRHARRLERARR